MRSFLLLLLVVSPLHAEWQNLWPAEAPDAKRPPAGTETLKEGGRINSVEVPQYFLYQPNAEKNNGSGSRDNLVGKNPPAELLEKLSTEKALWQAGLICLMLG